MNQAEPARSSIKKPESPGVMRFALQYLVSPILVVALGFYFNMRLAETRAELDRSKQQLERIEVAHQIIKSTLAGDYDQSFITLRLVQVVLEPELAAQVVDACTEYLKSKAEIDLAEGRPEEAVAIVNAAARIGGEAGKRVEQGIRESATIRDAPTELSKAREAEELTSLGFRFLSAGRYGEAMEAFGRVESVYPGYGTAAEILSLLQKNLRRMDDPEVEKRVLDSIVSRFSWKGPQQYVQDLRERCIRLLPVGR